MERVVARATDLSPFRRRALSAEIPETMTDLLTGKAHASLATVRPDGAPAIALTWVDYVDGRILTSSPVGARKGRNIRHDPRVGVMVVDPENPRRYLQMRGLVVEIRPDTNLEFIDRMSVLYRGVPYPVRDKDREIYVIEIFQVKAAGA